MATLRLSDPDPNPDRPPVTGRPHRTLGQADGPEGRGVPGHPLPGVAPLRTAYGFKLTHYQSGPLKGLDGLFNRYLPSKERCEVLLNWLGRRLLTTLDPTDLDIATRSGTTPGWVAGYGRIAPARTRAGAH